MKAESERSRIEYKTVAPQPGSFAFSFSAPGGWFEGQKLLVATRSVESVSWENKEVFVPHSRDSI
jgi:hypothetical protein